MFNLFQRYFNFKGIVFTHSKPIIQQAKEENITVIRNYQYSKNSIQSLPRINPYGLPYIQDMFVRATKMFSSDYYGYINSDIMLSYNIFEILELCKNNAKQGMISLRVLFSLWKFCFINSMKLLVECMRLNIIVPFPISHCRHIWIIFGMAGVWRNLSVTSIRLYF